MEYFLIATVIVVLALCHEKHLLQVWRLYEENRVKRNRTELAEQGLTPEEYMSTISPTDYQSYSEAVIKFWPRRNRHEKRDAALDRIASSLKDEGADDVKMLKQLENRWHGRQ